MKISKQQAEQLCEIIKELDKIASGEVVPCKTIGICHHIGIKFKCTLSRFINNIFRDYFDEMGLNCFFPVEGDFFTYQQNRDKYNPNTEYGHRRLLLAKEMSWAASRFLNSCEITRSVDG